MWRQRCHEAHEVRHKAKLPGWVKRGMSSTDGRAIWLVRAQSNTHATVSSLRQQGWHPVRGSDWDTDRRPSEKAGLGMEGSLEYQSIRKLLLSERILRDRKWDKRLPKPELRYQVYLNISLSEFYVVSPDLVQVCLQPVSTRYKAQVIWAGACPVSSLCVFH